MHVDKKFKEYDVGISIQNSPALGGKKEKKRKRDCLMYTYNSPIKTSHKGKLRTIDRDIKL